MPELVRTIVSVLDRLLDDFPSPRRRRRHLAAVTTGPAPSAAAQVDRGQPDPPDLEEKRREVSRERDLHSTRYLKDAVRRDLNDLLNSRRSLLAEESLADTEIATSLVFYGLPDFTGLSLSNTDAQTHIRRAIEDAIAAFEPRLERVQVDSADPRRGRERTLGFHVSAMLKVDPVPERVDYDAELRVMTQEYKVRSSN